MSMPPRNVALQPHRTEHLVVWSDHGGCLRRYIAVIDDPAAMLRGWGAMQRRFGSPVACGAPFDVAPDSSADAAPNTAPGTDRDHDRE